MIFIDILKHRMLLPFQNHRFVAVYLLCQFLDFDSGHVQKEEG